MTVSVVVPARNDRAHLARLHPVLVEGFRAQGLAAEVVVVATDCRDGSEDWCRDAGVRCVASSEALRPSVARNAGVEASSGQWLAFLDADVVPLPAWFERLARLIDARDENVAAGWPVIVPPGAHWLAVAWERVRMAAGRMPRYINSGNLIVSRTLFDRISGFDPARVSGEDVDFCDRARAAGGTLLFDADLAAYHYGEPPDLRSFFRRQLFHSEALSMVVRHLLSPLNLAVGLIIVATLFSVVAAISTIAAAGTIGFAWLVLGPAVLAIMAFAKAYSGWQRSVSTGLFARMVIASAVMLVARVVGAFWRQRSWR